MKKQILILCGLLSISQCHSMYMQPAETQQLASFANIYFNPDKTPFFNNKTMWDWTNAIEPIKMFVLNNNKNMLGMADKNLNQALNLFIQASNLFINTASEMLRNPKTLQNQKDYFQNKINEIKNLWFITSEMVNKRYTDGSKKEQVRLVLYDADMQLKGMVDKLETLLNP